MPKLSDAADIHNEVYQNLNGSQLPIPANMKSPVTDPVTEKLIADKEKEALIDQGEFKEAEITWIDFMKQNPQNIRILEGMFSFYKEYHNTFSPESVLKNILSFKNYFEEEPRFFRILATIYTRLRDVLPKDDAKKNAISAAKKSVNLEPDNPRWQGLLGYVYYWFDDIEQGIFHTEKAFEQSKDQEDENLTMHLRNNLACYYASERIHEKEARDYSKTVYEYYKLSGNNTEPEEDAMEKMAMGFDSVGYVKLRFAKTKEEIEESTSYFNNALRLFLTLEIVTKHLQEAYLELLNYKEKAKK